jgi:hypothetical protein
MHNNSFPIHPQRSPTRKPRKHLETTQTPMHKWDTFIYIGKETTFITNIFRRANLKTAFRTNNTTGNILMHKHQMTDRHTLSGVYELTCPDCKKAYVGQTGSSFTVRFNEHKNTFQTNSHTFKFAQHLIKHNHSFDTIHNTMQVLQHHSKGAHLHTVERFYIYAEYTTNHLNDNQTIFPNKIFGILLKPHHS